LYYKDSKRICLKKEVNQLEIEREMLKGYIDIIILALLYGEDLYGYELGKRVKNLTQNSFELKEGTLYLAFKRLEQSGFISSYWGEESVGGRRKYYKLLPDGRRHLSARKKEWEHLKKIMDLFLKGVNCDD
jgi:PadR family transcriptional regulator PadR